MAKFNEVFKDNWDFYEHAISLYNSDEVAHIKFNANEKEELIEFFKKKAAEDDLPSGIDKLFDTEDEVEVRKYLESIIEWDGPGYYDIHGLESNNYGIQRIDRLLSWNLFDINLEELVEPELIEKRYGGKVYAISNTKLQFIIIDDTEEYNASSPDLFSILKDAGVNLKNYFCWDNFQGRWLGDTVRVVDMSDEDTLNFLQKEKEIDTYYISRV